MCDHGVFKIKAALPKRNRAFSKPMEDVPGVPWVACAGGEVPPRVVGAGGEGGRHASVCSDPTQSVQS